MTWSSLCLVASIQRLIGYLLLSTFRTHYWEKVILRYDSPKTICAGVITPMAFSKIVNYMYVIVVLI